GDRAIGRVTATSNDTITLTTRDGSSLTVHVDGDTVYRIPANDTATIDDITVDMVVGVEGRAREDGSIDASMVAGGLGRGKAGGRGFGGPGLGGHRFGGPGFDARGGQGGQGWDDQGDENGTSPSAAPSGSTSAS
ncbi:MAG: hypothetical protein H0U58_04920, partial [Chloroflexi bacterium]|nr:hypothetical protein [Chloroflexota bacterium]